MYYKLTSMWFQGLFKCEVKITSTSFHTCFNCFTLSSDPPQVTRWSRDILNVIFQNSIATYLSGISTCLSPIGWFILFISFTTIPRTTKLPFKIKCEIYKTIGGGGDPHTKNYYIITLLTLLKRNLDCITFAILVQHKLWVTS